MRVKNETRPDAFATIYGCEFAEPLAGQVRLRPGDVVRGESIVVKAGLSNAKVIPLAKQRRRIVPHLDPAKAVEFETAEGVVAIAPCVDAELVTERRGEQGVKDFLAGKGAPAKDAESTGLETKGNDGMAKKAKLTKEERAAAKAAAKQAKAEAKAAKKAAGKNGDTASKGKLGELFGCSITSVLRRLGKEGVTTAHAKAIFKARGLDAAPATVQIQICNGRNGKGTPADITAAQVKELKDSADEPKKEEAEAK